MYTEKSQIYIKETAIVALCQILYIIIRTL